jgi:hypothetical protein
VRFNRFLVDANRPYRRVVYPHPEPSPICRIEGVKVLALPEHQGHDDYREHDDKRYHDDQLEHRCHRMTISTVRAFDRRGFGSLRTDFRQSIA